MYGYSAKPSKFTQSSYLAHHGIKGQKWGVRRFENPDGTLTEAGKRRYRREFSNAVTKATAIYNTAAVIGSTGVVAGVIASLPTLGLSLLPAMLIAAGSMAAMDAANELYDTKISELRKSTKDYKKVEKELYNESSKFRKIKDYDNKRKELIKEERKSQKEYDQKLKERDKLLRITRNGLKQKGLSSKEKIDLYKNFIVNAPNDIEDGGIGDPKKANLPKYWKREDFDDNLDYYAKEYFGSNELLTKEEKDVLAKYYGFK